MVTRQQIRTVLIDLYGFATDEMVTEVQNNLKGE